MHTRLGGDADIAGGAAALYLYLAQTSFEKMALATGVTKDFCATKHPQAVRAGGGARIQWRYTIGFGSSRPVGDRAVVGPLEPR